MTKPVFSFVIEDKPVDADLPKAEDNIYEMEAEAVLSQLEVKQSVVLNREMYRLHRLFQLGKSLDVKFSYRSLSWPNVRVGRIK